MLEPADSHEARDLTALAFDLSERFDVPVLVRMTTRVCHARSVVALGAAGLPPMPDARAFARDPAKLVMLPGHARVRHRVMLERLEALRRSAETSPLNRTEWRDRTMGVVTSGVAYHYVREVLPAASVLKLGWSHPLPAALVREFAAGVCSSSWWKSWSRTWRSSSGRWVPRRGQGVLLPGGRAEPGGRPPRLRAGRLAEAGRAGALFPGRRRPTPTRALSRAVRTWRRIWRCATSAPW